MRIFQLFAGGALLIAGSLAATAQVVQYDWAARSLQSYPTNITQTSSAQVQVHNVNDIVGYSYTVASSCTSNPVTPFETIAGLLPTTALSPNKAPDACSTTLDSANLALSNAAKK